MENPNKKKRSLTNAVVIIVSLVLIFTCAGIAYVKFIKPSDQPPVAAAQKPVTTTQKTTTATQLAVKEVAAKETAKRVSISNSTTEFEINSLDFTDGRLFLKVKNVSEKPVGGYTMGRPVGTHDPTWLITVEFYNGNEGIYSWYNNIIVSNSGAPISPGEEKVFRFYDCPPDRIKPDTRCVISIFKEKIPY